MNYGAPHKGLDLTRPLTPERHAIMDYLAANGAASQPVELASEDYRWWIWLLTSELIELVSGNTFTLTARGIEYCRIHGIEVL